MVLLYADDDVEDQELFAEIVHTVSPDIMILIAENGVDAVEMLTQGHLPDLIFLDSLMPRMSGHETLFEIRKHAQFNHIEVILWSSGAQPQTSHYFASLNARALEKPSTMREGIDSLGAIIEEAKALQNSRH